MGQYDESDFWTLNTIAWNVFFSFLKGDDDYSKTNDLNSFKFADNL